MKKIYIILFFLITAAISGIFVFAGENDKDTDASQKIRKGTFLKVMVPIDISTLTSDIGDEVWFVNTQDMYVYETNAVPSGTKIYGEIEDVKEPVMGRDAAIKILVNKMITPDKKVYKIQGHIYSENDNYIGGKETAPTYYRKVPHYSYRLRPFLQAAPLKVLEYGRHTEIKPGQELFIIFDEDVKLK